VRCYGREDLTTVASIMLTAPLEGENLAIITHAGGPAVMLTDELAKGGLDVPHLEGPKAEELLSFLFPGSSAANPIDLLATGNAEQVGVCIDFCEKAFPEIDGIVVIFGTPGLTPVYDVYEVLHEKMLSCSKPIYPVLPSVTTAREEVNVFLSRGHTNFPDEVLLGEALSRIHNTPFPIWNSACPGDIYIQDIRNVIEEAGEGYLDPDSVGKILDAAGILRVKEGVVADETALLDLSAECGFPLVMKVVGPVHKSDVGGVTLGIDNEKTLLSEFHRMMQIDEAEGVLLQPILEGIELFVGAKYEPEFGHVVLCGLGGIMVEVLKDVSAGLAPLTMAESHRMISSLRGVKILDGVRGQEGISKEVLAGILVKFSNMLVYAEEIAEIDLNPILGKGSKLVAVDARIRIQK